MSLPPTFFNIMLRFVVYFVEEVELCGPIQARWSYLLEMYMKDLKNFAGQKPILKATWVRLFDKGGISFVRSCYHW